MHSQSQMKHDGEIRDHLQDRLRAMVLAPLTNVENAKLDFAFVRQRIGMLLLPGPILPTCVMEGIMEVACRSRGRRNGPHLRERP